MKVLNDISATEFSRLMQAFSTWVAPVEGYPVLSQTDTREIIYSILSNDQRQRLEIARDRQCPSRPDVRPNIISIARCLLS